MKLNNKMTGGHDAEGEPFNFNSDKDVGDKDVGDLEFNIEEINSNDSVYIPNGIIDEDTKMVTVDDLIDKVGGCGRYQILLEVLVSIMVMASSFQPLLMYFAGHSPNWKCATNNRSTETCNISGVVDPSDSELYNSRCKMNRDAWEFVTDKDYSFITEYNLVCNAAVYGTLGNSAFYIGWVLGALPSGVVSDYFGRKPVMFISFLIIMSSSLGLAFATTYTQVVGLRIVTGLAQGGFQLTSYIIASENVGVKFRAAMGNILFIVSVFAYVILDFQAFYVHKWRVLMILCSAPYLGLLIFYMCVPESLRWLTTKKKMGKAENVLRKMARANKKPMYQFKILLTKLEHKVGKTKASVVDIIRHRLLLSRSLIQGFGWLVCGMTYYGISLASADLSGNFYRDFALTSIVEIPSVFMVISGVERFGRKKVISICLCIAGLTCGLIPLFPVKSSYRVVPLLRVTCGMLGKLFNSVAFNGFYVWSTELYPTVIRTQGLSFVYFLARIGAASAPTVTTGLKLVHPAFPFLLMGLLSFISGLVSLFLPETKGKVMLETLEDALKDSTSQSTSDRIPLKNMDELRLTSDDSDEDIIYSEKAALL